MSDEPRNYDGLTFDEWMKEVDQVLEAEVGLTSDCLADFHYWDYWSDGVSPEHTAGECLVEMNDFDYEDLSPELQY